ncbi:MAG: replication protein RepA [Acidobacteria bacterium]|nr:replication protein RepA [Acidobacteriota bacterium]
MLSDAKAAGVIRRLATVCALPWTSQGDARYFTRQIGPLKHHLCRTVSKHLPYGVWPKLLFAWICTEIERTGSPKVLFGESLNQFLQQVGVTGSHQEGRWASTTGLCDQMRYFFSCVVGLKVSDELNTSSMTHTTAAVADLRWEADDPTQNLLWTTSIEVHDPLFREIKSHPVALEVEVLAAALGSLLRLDLFLLLTYRMHDLTMPVQIPWEELRQHFGPELEEGATEIAGNLPAAVSCELGVLSAAWPALDYVVTDGWLEVRPPLPR